ncbi:MAG: NUDIX hydrolase [Anaerolineae bacterium]
MHTNQVDDNEHPRYARPLALGIIKRTGDTNTLHEILVCEYYDHVKEKVFYRPLGGAIEFGERGQEALRREFREELNTELADVRYLATLENIFTYKGQVGHEIVLLYEATFANPSAYERAVLTMEDEGNTLTARWMPLDTFQEGPPLYPDGLLDLLTDDTT